MQIHDSRFLRTLARRFIGRSRQLDGCRIEVVDCGPTLGLDVRIDNTAFIVLAITWLNDSAHVVPGSSFLRVGDLVGLEDALSDCVRRFLRQHMIIGADGRSTVRRGVA